MIICMAFATVLFMVYAYLYLTAGENLYQALLMTCMEIQQETMKETQSEMLNLAEQLKKNSQNPYKKKLKNGQKLKKKYDECNKQM